MRQPAKVQSVIVPKDRFTKRQAQSWVAKHGFIDPGVDETEHYFRFRQMDPDRQHFKYRTIPFGHDGIQAVVRVSRLPQMRSNPGSDDFDALVDAIRAAPTDQKAMQLAYPMAFQLAQHLGVPVSTARGVKALMETAQAVAQAVRSGAGASVASKVAAMPEVAQALAGTGLVPVALAQATQIAEVQTSQGVVDVPVMAEYPAPAVDPSRFYIDGRFHLLTAYRAVGEVEGLLEDYLHSLPEAEVKKIAKAERVGKGTKEELISALLREAERQNNRGMVFLTSDRPTAADAVQAIDALRHTAHTARRQAETEGLRERTAQILAGLSVSDLKKVAQHYTIDLQRTPADRRVEKIVENTVGWTLRARAVRGDYEEDEEARVRERDEQQQWMMAQYRERHGLPPLRNNPEWAKSLGKLAQRGASATAKGARRAASYAAEVGRDFSHGVRSAHQEAAQSGSAGMPSGLVDKVEDLASQNLYMDAVALVAKALGEKGVAKQAKKLDAKQDKIGHLTPDLHAEQEALAQSVFTAAQAAWGAAAARALHSAYAGAM